LHKSQEQLPSLLLLFQGRDFFEQLFVPDSVLNVSIFLCDHLKVCWSKMTTEEGENRTPFKGNSFSIYLPIFPTSKKREQETLCYDEFYSVSINVAFEFAK
jgi:hypothetical protein